MLLTKNLLCGKICSVDGENVASAKTFLKTFSLTWSLSLDAAFEVFAKTITPPTGLSSLCTNPK